MVSQICTNVWRGCVRACVCVCARACGLEATASVTHARYGTLHAWIADIAVCNITVRKVHHPLQQPVGWEAPQSCHMMRSFFCALERFGRSTCIHQIASGTWVQSRGCTCGWCYWDLPLLILQTRLCMPLLTSHSPSAALGMLAVPTQHSYLLIYGVCHNAVSHCNHFLRGTW